MGENVPVKRKSRIAERREKISGGMTYADWKGRYVEKDKTQNDSKQINGYEKIRAKLEETRSEVGLKGQILYPPPKFNFDSFVFDIEHARGGKHPHDVSEEEARQFIQEAYFAIYALKAGSYNYYGKNGGVFVQPRNKTIRTAFKAAEYNPKIQKLIEVFENEIG